MIDSVLGIYYFDFDNYSSELYGYSMIAMDGFENRHEGGGVLSRSYIKPFETYNDFNIIFQSEVKY